MFVKVTDRLSCKNKNPRVKDISLKKNSRILWLAKTTTDSENIPFRRLFDDKKAIKKNIEPENGCLVQKYFWLSHSKFVVKGKNFRLEVCIHHMIAARQFSCIVFGRLIVV